MVNVWSLRWVWTIVPVNPSQARGTCLRKSVLCTLTPISSTGRTMEHLPTIKKNVRSLSEKLGGNPSTLHNYSSLRVRSHKEKAHFGLLVDRFGAVGFLVIMWHRGILLQPNLIHVHARNFGGATTFGGPSWTNSPADGRLGLRTIPPSQVTLSGADRRTPFLPSD